MVSKRTVTAVCDNCRSTKDVRRRTIRQSEEEGSRQLTFDVCDDCRRTVPLADWEGLIPSQSTKGRSLGTTPVMDGPRAVLRITKAS